MIIQCSGSRRIVNNASGASAGDEQDDFFFDALAILVHDARARRELSE